MKYLYFYLAFNKSASINGFSTCLNVIWETIRNRNQIDLIDRTIHQSIYKELVNEFTINDKGVDCVEVLWNSEQDENLFFTKNYIQPKFKSTIIVVK